MSSFAIYRLPLANTCTVVEQVEGAPIRLSSCSGLNGQQGFVVAPFSVTAATPLLLIRPDRICQKPIENPVPHSVRITHAEPHHDTYSLDFANCHAQLKAGLFRKIVLARHAVVYTHQPIEPLQLFWLACQRYPRLFIALVALPDGSSWLTATPEILLEGTDRGWRTIALAGTMQLKGDELSFDSPPSADARSVDNLRWSTKNIQEQRYVATYIAQTLERLNIGYHEEGPRTVRAANLVHLRSDFSFQLTDTSHIGTLLQALHPTPAVCGLPKDDTFRFITTHEHADRQYYSGFMGPLNIADNATATATHLFVALRCMQIRANEHRLYAGGGLLCDSDEEQEWQETEAKMQTMLNLLEPY